MTLVDALWCFALVASAASFVGASMVLGAQLASRARRSDGALCACAKELPTRDALRAWRMQGALMRVTCTECGVRWKWVGEWARDVYDYERRGT